MLNDPIVEELSKVFKLQDECKLSFLEKIRLRFAKPHFSYDSENGIRTTVEMRVIGKGKNSKLYIVNVWQYDIEKNLLHHSSIY